MLFLRLCSNNITKKTGNTSAREAGSCWMGASTNRDSHKKGSSRGPMTRARWESLVSWRTWRFSHGARGEAPRVHNGELNRSFLHGHRSHEPSRAPRGASPSRALLWEAAAAQREPDFHSGQVKSQITPVFICGDVFKSVTIKCKYWA